MMTRKFYLEAVLRVTLAVTLFSQQVLAAVPLALPGDVRANLESLAGVIRIPRVLGQIEEVYSPEGLEPGKTPLIVHIKDAHANVEAQMRIRDLIHWLNEHYGFDRVAVEGAAVKLDPNVLRFFGKKERDLAVAEYLAKKGELSGVDLLLVDEPELSIHGIEEASEYAGNFAAFRAVMAHEEDSERFANYLESQIDLILPHLLNKDLLKLVRLWRGMQVGDAELLSYVDTLARAAAKHLATDLSDFASQFDWPELTRLLKLKEIEPRLRWQDIAKEREKLLDFLKEIDLEASLFEKVVDIGARDKRKPDSREVENGERGPDPRLVFERLYQAAAPRGFRFEDYPAYSLYAQYCILQSEIESKALFQEMGALADKLLENLAEKETERETIVFIRDVRLFKKALFLELVREDVGKLEQTAAKLGPEELARRLSLLRAEARIANNKVDIRPTALRLAGLLGEVLEFYRRAERRENTFVAKALELARAGKEPKLIVVTGGYHTDGIKQRLQKAGMSYLVVSPRIAKAEDSKRYRDVMLNRNETIFDVAQLSDIRKPQPRDVIAIQAGDQAAATLAHRSLAFLEAVLAANPEVTQVTAVLNRHGDLSHDFAYRVGTEAGKPTELTVVGRESGNVFSVPVGQTVTLTETVTYPVSLQGVRNLTPATPPYDLAASLGARSTPVEIEPLRKALEEIRNEEFLRTLDEFFRLRGISDVTNVEAERRLLRALVDSNQVDILLEVLRALEPRLTAMTEVSSTERDRILGIVRNLIEKLAPLTSESIRQLTEGLRTIVDNYRRDADDQRFASDLEVLTSNPSFPLNNDQVVVAPVFTEVLQEKLEEMQAVDRGVVPANQVWHDLARISRDIGELLRDVGSETPIAPLALSRPVTQFRALVVVPTPPGGAPAPQRELEEALGALASSPASEPLRSRVRTLAFNPKGEPTPALQEVLESPVARQRIQQLIAQFGGPVAPAVETAEAPATSPAVNLPPQEIIPVLREIVRQPGEIRGAAPRIPLTRPQITEVRQALAERNFVPLAEALREAGVLPLPRGAQAVEPLRLNLGSDTEAGPEIARVLAEAQTSLSDLLLASRAPDLILVPNIGPLPITSLLRAINLALVALEPLVLNLPPSAPTLPTDNRPITRAEQILAARADIALREPRPNLQPLVELFDNPVINERITQGQALPAPVITVLTETQEQVANLTPSNTPPDLRPQLLTTLTQAADRIRPFVEAPAPGQVRPTPPQGIDLPTLLNRIDTAIVRLTPGIGPVTQPRIDRIQQEIAQPTPVLEAVGELIRPTLGLPPDLAAQVIIANTPPELRPQLLTTLTQAAQTIRIPVESPEAVLPGQAIPTPPQGIDLPTLLNRIDTAIVRLTPGIGPVTQPRIDRIQQEIAQPTPVLEAVGELIRPTLGLPPDLAAQVIIANTPPELRPQLLTTLTQAAQTIRIPVESPEAVLPGQAIPTPPQGIDLPTLLNRIDTVVVTLTPGIGPVTQALPTTAIGPEALTLSEAVARATQGLRREPTPDFEPLLNLLDRSEVTRPLTTGEILPAPVTAVLIEAQETIRIVLDRGIEVVVIAGRPTSLAEIQARVMQTLEGQREIELVLRALEILAALPPTGPGNFPAGSVQQTPGFDVVPALPSIVGLVQRLESFRHGEPLSGLPPSVSQVVASSLRILRETPNLPATFETPAGLVSTQDLIGRLENVQERLSPPGAAQPSEQALSVAPPAPEAPGQLSDIIQGIVNVIERTPTLISGIQTQARELQGQKPLPAAERLEDLVNVDLPKLVQDLRDRVEELASQGPFLPPEIRNEVEVLRETLQDVNTPPLLTVPGAENSPEAARTIIGSQLLRLEESLQQLLPTITFQLLPILRDIVTTPGLPGLPSLPPGLEQELNIPDILNEAAEGFPSFPVRGPQFVQLVQSLSDELAEDEVSLEAKVAVIKLAAGFARAGLPTTVALLLLEISFPELGLARRILSAESILTAREAEFLKIALEIFPSLTLEKQNTGFLTYYFEGVAPNLDQLASVIVALKMSPNFIVRLVFDEEMAEEGKEQIRSLVGEIGGLRDVVFGQPINIGGSKRIDAAFVPRENVPTFLAEIATHAKPGEESPFDMAKASSPKKIETLTDFYKRSVFFAKQPVVVKIPLSTEAATLVYSAEANELSGRFLNELFPYMNFKLSRIPLVDELSEEDKRELKRQKDGTNQFSPNINAYMQFLSRWIKGYKSLLRAA
jgi:hypothetical protein